MPFGRLKTSAFVAGVDNLDKASLWETARLAMIANAWRAFPLGGSRSVGLSGAGPADADNYIDLELDGVLLAGYTVQIRVDVKTANVGTSVTPQLYDVTAAGVLTTTGGSAHALTSWGSQTLVVTSLPAATHKYRLQFVKSNATNDVYGIGYLELKSP